MFARLILSALLLAPLAAPAQGIVVDHTCTDLSQVPSWYLDQARSTLRVGYGHTSHGSQLVTGMDAWKGTGQPRYDFASSGWGLAPGVFLNDLWGNAGGAADLGYEGDLTWRDATLAMLEEPGNDRNVVIWSWCGGVSDNTPEGIQAYLDAMAGLEAAYPAVRFVYMTGHLDGSGAEGNLNRRNEQIRAWCAAHGKVLFDFADIESYAPGGTTDYRALYATDGCEYDTNGDGNPWGDGNWAQEWVAAHPAAELATVAAGCDECSHSQRLNCVLKGGAFWWLMARLLGWDPAASCMLDCEAAVPASCPAGSAVAFQAQAHPDHCTGDLQYLWDFGDGGASAQQNPTRAYASEGNYSWSLTVSIAGATCVKTGTIAVFPPGGDIPGDCDQDGGVSIGEVQRAINMFLGIEPVACGADCNGDGAISIGEVQRVILVFLGIAWGCP